MPKEAVCNVSLAAIRAAIFPLKTDYLYFVRDKNTGVHIFSTNIDDHNKAINYKRKIILIFLYKTVKLEQYLLVNIKNYKKDKND